MGFLPLVRARYWVALGALAVAIALLSPALTPLSGSMDSFATDLAQGSFRPFGQLGGPQGASSSFTDSLGGLTGASTGNYLPGANALPKSWQLDRDGHGGLVTIDYVFNPSLGAMQRLKAYDRIAVDGETLQVADASLRPISSDPTLRYDRIIEGSFPVSFHRDVPIPIYSPHPKAAIERVTVDPPLAGGVQFFKDGADTYYALGHVEKIATLNITFRISADYYLFSPPVNTQLSAYRYSAALPKPVVPASLVDDAKLVLSRAGVTDAKNVGDVLGSLADYFRSFTEGDIPGPGEFDNLYLALALGEKGCCRHRAFAFMITAQSVGIPTRVVVNEAHAFVEVALPDGKWRQINLGGCGTYAINNPKNYPSLFDQADDPRGEANPDENQPLPSIATITEITESPSRIVKGETYFVNGTVVSADNRPVAGARIDVYLNETKTTPGRLTGAGTTDAEGRFSVLAKVPADAPARSYQLVARSTNGHDTQFRLEESWSDPPVDVFAPTRFAFASLSAASGVPTSLNGRLIDIEGAGVPNATIQWSADGAARPDVVTSATGRFTLQVQFNTTGNHAIAVKYDGTEHHGASAGEATVTVTTGAIILPSEAPVLVRNKVSGIEGNVVLQGVPASGHEVIVALDLKGPITARTTTNPLGHFSAGITLPADAQPGIYNATISVPDLKLIARTPVRVVAGVVMTLDAAKSIGLDDGWTLEAIIESDNGTRVLGGLVELTLDGQKTSLLTNRTGVARFETPAAQRAAGEHVATIRFAGDSQRESATQTLTLNVQEAWYTNVPAWVFGLSAAALVVLLAASVLVMPRPRQAAGAWLSRRARPERRFLALAFPDHPPGVAPVFEPGEKFRARVLARDLQGNALDAKLGIVAGKERFTARSRGEEGVIFELTAPASGDLALLAHAKGIGRLYTRPVSRVVPIASFRQAVEREFVKLRAEAGLGPEATSGDLAARVPLAARAGYLFDLADYSDAPVDRAYYHAFARAVAAARDRLEGHDA